MIKTFHMAVHGSPLESQAHYSALRYAESLIGTAKLTQVFFFHEAAAVANRLTVPLSDEFVARRAWREFAAENSVRLCVCIASSERRGVVDTASQHDHNLASENVDHAFEIVGLGEFCDALATHDHFMSFV